MKCHELEYHDISLHHNSFCHTFAVFLLGCILLSLYTIWEGFNNDHPFPRHELKLPVVPEHGDHNPANIFLYQNLHSIRELLCFPCTIFSLVSGFLFHHLTLFSTRRLFTSCFRSYKFHYSFQVNISSGVITLGFHVNRF